MKYLALVVIHQDGSLRRWEFESGTDFSSGKDYKKLTASHEAGFIPTGDRAKELQVIERFRKAPDPRFGVDAPGFQPEDYLWMAPDQTAEY